MAVSILLGSLAVVVGLLISFHYGTAGGATMAGISVLLFFIALIGDTSVNFLRTQRT